MERLYKALGALLGLGIWVFLIATTWILLYQVWTYLKDGVWPAMSFMIVIEYINPEWARNPESWKGLHKLLDMPLSLGLILTAMLYSYLIIQIANVLESEIQKSQKQNKPN